MTVFATEERRRARGGGAVGGSPSSLSTFSYLRTTRPLGMLSLEPAHASGSAFLPEGVRVVTAGLPEVTGASTRG